MRDELTEYIAESFETPVPIVMKWVTAFISTKGLSPLTLLFPE
jgi:hypothetical protein